MWKVGYALYKELSDPGWPVGASSPDVVIKELGSRLME